MIIKRMDRVRTGHVRHALRVSQALETAPRTRIQAQVNAWEDGLLMWAQLSQQAQQELAAERCQ